MRPMIHGAIPRKPPLDSRNAWRTRRLVRQHIEECKQTMLDGRGGNKDCESYQTILNHTDWNKWVLERSRCHLASSRVTRHPYRRSKQLQGIRNVWVLCRDKAHVTPIRKTKRACGVQRKFSGTIFEKLWAFFRILEMFRWTGVEFPLAVPLLLPASAPKLLAALSLMLRFT